MTIKELEDYRYMPKEIDALEKQINALYNVYHSPSFDSNGGFSLTPSNPTEQAVDRIISLQRTLKQKKDDLSKKMAEIENWTDSLEDPDIRAIVRLRYLTTPSFSWEQISYMIYGYSNEKQAYRVFRRFMGVDK